MKIPDYSLCVNTKSGTGKAAIGLTCGFGMFVVALAATLLVLLTLLGLFHLDSVEIIDTQCDRDLAGGAETLTYEVSLPRNVPPRSLMELAGALPQITRISIR